MLGIAQLQFADATLEARVFVALLGAASIAVAGRSFQVAETMHVPSAACYAGWAIVALTISTAPFENRIFGFAVMLVASLAFLAHRADGTERTLSPRRRGD